MTKEMTKKENKPKFSTAITTPAYQKLISNTLGDPERCKRFVAAISSAVANNQALQKCDAGTVLCGALQGEALNLSPSAQLGQYYLVPFEQKEKKDKDGNIVQKAMTRAVFILGYKGYIQLAIRSGQYKKLNVIELKQGELIKFDPLNEEIKVSLIEDFAERESAETAGYYAMFEYLNGFRKAIYWSKEKMISHADRYSKAFDADAFSKLQKGQIPDNELWKYSSFWYKDFDEMAKKTLIRQLISKWGIMSLEMQRAYEADQSISEMDENCRIVLNSSDFEYSDLNEAPEGTTDKVETTQEASQIVQQAGLDDFE